jgi:N-acetylglucosaminyl-diphospho-decaprenol L-rhamnosyltransferase
LRFGSGSFLHVVEVDVVVVTYNSRDHVQRCLAALGSDPRLAITVVDNASSDGTPELLERDDVRLLAQSHNGGFAVGCNIGARAGSAPVIVFLNPDSEVTPEGLLGLAECLRRDPRVGAVGPQIRDEDGRLQWSVRRVPSFATSLGSAFFIPRIWPRTRWSLDVATPATYAQATSADWVSGACLAVRRELFEQLGGFDERFFMYYEDADLCRRVHEAGFDVRYEPSVEVVHVGAASAPRARMIPTMTDSRILYARKHGGARGEAVERALTALHALTHVALTTQGREARVGHLHALEKALGPSRQSVGTLS